MNELSPQAEVDPFDPYGSLELQKRFPKSDAHTPLEFWIDYASLCFDQSSKGTWEECRVSLCALADALLKLAAEYTEKRGRRYFEFGSQHDHLAIYRLAGRLAGPPMGEAERRPGIMLPLKLRADIVRHLLEPMMCSRPLNPMVRNALTQLWGWCSNPNNGGKEPADFFAEEEEGEWHIRNAIRKGVPW